MPLVTYAKFAATRMYPPKPSKLIEQSYFSIFTRWPHLRLQEAVRFAALHAPGAPNISHVRYCLQNEMVFWQYLTWLRHEGEVRFGLHNGALIGWLRLHKALPRITGNHLGYLEFTISRIPQEKWHVINRVVLHNPQLQQATTTPLENGRGDIRSQPNHAEDIFAALPPY